MIRALWSLAVFLSLLWVGIYSTRLFLWAIQVLIN